MISTYRDVARILFREGSEPPLCTCLCVFVRACVYVCVQTFKKFERVLNPRSPIPLWLRLCPPVEISGAKFRLLRNMEDVIGGSADSADSDAW